ncbi:type I-D CRISPR-associated helicase Cas3' [Oxynema aestuarii]|uniref:Type I-D CRISPR-associated helicase Cas3 n=1 Tax=Oxynema aestuarii AP17 TaxID=2064643 RepID=A0A6H1TVT2_9CYAN|nr:type I-D CRISPR-associated helicase Cas3' [Oxynema aestuarii]QIZ69863.1 type I-D CRISPR-associated helicase Cas3' [Oxynema aestuarii AP17]
MKLRLHGLHSQLNPGVGRCPLGCDRHCQVRERAPGLQPPPGATCPLSSHQAQTFAAVRFGDADLIFNKSATGDGKTLGGTLPTLLDPQFRLMALYPTIELVEDQTRQQQRYHELFGLQSRDRVDRLYGEELSRRVRERDSNKFQELLDAIYHTPILLTNPDIFHYITHYRYRQAAFDRALLPLALAEWPDLWMFDEFHIFGPHQEAAALNSLTLIRRSQQQRRPRRFLFTSATPKPDFIAQLARAEFKIAEIEGIYANETTPGFRQILQPVELEFVQLGDGDAVQWLVESADRLDRWLRGDRAGRGLIVLNAISSVNRAIAQLTERLPGVTVCEISGRIDRRERGRIQAQLQASPDPVLVVATSAVDVGVDFRINLLVFESSDAATVVQRLGRLGRHPGFSHYRAAILIPKQMPWVMPRLGEWGDRQEPVGRPELQEAIAIAFDPPKSFAEYRQKWGPLQAHGMLAEISRESNKVSEILRDRMREDLGRVYGDRFDRYRKCWFALGKNPVGKATQKELLRFRGATAIQAAIADGSRIYTYDLLRLLPYTWIERCDRETFLEAARTADCSPDAFDDRYIHVYLKVREWLDNRQSLSLQTQRDTDELKTCELTLLDRLAIVGHPQPEVSTCLQRRKLLAFLVPVHRSQPSSHWQVSYTLQLGPHFGLYRLTDAGGNAYACAFDRDALLLDALKFKLRRFCRTQPQSLIF